MLEYGDGLWPSTVRLGTIRICECVLFASIDYITLRLFMFSL